jgi:hypothetical protein
VRAKEREEGQVFSVGQSTGRAPWQAPRKTQRGEQVNRVGGVQRKRLVPRRS